MSKTLDAEAVGALIGTTARHVRHLARNRAIPHWKAGGRFRFDADEIADWLDERRVRPDEVTR